MDHGCVDHNKCINQAINMAEDRCLKNKLNFTPLRRKILEFIWLNHFPKKAYDILEQLSLEDQKAKPITVYRALDFLIENKMIHKIESQNAFFGCSHPGSQHNCYFTICRECNKVQETCNNQIITAIKQDLKM